MLTRRHVGEFGKALFALGLKCTDIDENKSADRSDSPKHLYRFADYRPLLVDHVSDETVFVRITAWTGILGVVAGVSSLSKSMQDRGLIR